MTQKKNVWLFFFLTGTSLYLIWEYWLNDYDWILNLAAVSSLIGFIFMLKTIKFKK